MTTTDIKPAMTGLEQMQQRIAERLRAPIAEALDFWLVEIEDGRAVIESKPSYTVHNSIGSAHGGYAATLLDTACGCAVQSRVSATQTYATLELKVAYHKAINAETGLLRADGRVVSMGRRAAFTEAKLTDAQGRLYATATSSLMVFDK